MAKVKAAEPSVKWFKTTKQLGEVRLLPSDIDPRVLIRKPKMSHRCGGYGSCAEFSIVCLLNARTRTINCMNRYSSSDSAQHIEGLNTPKIIFQYDLNSLALNIKKNIGYLYLLGEDKGTLAEALKDPKGFYFPHVYTQAYMCLINRNHDSPRVLNNVFWDSNFNYYASKEQYKAYMANSSSSRDADHKITLSNYIDFFETDKKPTAIFTSSDPKILAKAGDSVFPGKKYVVGFAWFVKNRWWIYLKDNIFLRLTPEQVKAI